MNFWKSLSKDPIFPYFFPFFLFGFFLWLESLTPQAVYAVYPIKTFVVGLTLAWLWPRFPSFGPLTKETKWLSVAVGVAGFALWVGLDPVWVEHKDPTAGFNPYTFKDSGWGPAMAWGLIAFRLIGAVCIVPIMEEVFWRGFLMRFLITEKTGIVNDDFEKVPIGTFRWFSFVVTTAIFASVHGPQWPLGVVVGILYGWWFVRTKSLGAVIIAHAVTNLLLGVYVLVSQRWYFW